MSETPPVPKYELTLTISGNSHDEIERELLSMSDDERADLLRAWPWPREAATTAAGFADVVAVVERILAARAVQPVPAPEVSRGVAEALRELERVYSLANEATLNPLTDEARGFRRGVLDALGDAMGIVRDALPADDGADCCRERTTAGGCGCGGGS